MVVPLSAPNVEKLVIAFLTPHLTNVSVQMWNEPPMPFFLVRRISGGTGKITDHPTVSIHCFAPAFDAASAAADQMHDLMCNWTAKDTVTFGSHNYGADLVEVVEAPKWVDYANDNLQRYVGRYSIDLRVNHL